MKNLLGLLTCALLSCSLSASALAQDDPPADTPPSAERDSPTTATNNVASKPNQNGAVQVRVKLATGDEKPLANTPVLLSARRPMGPFEEVAPKATQEWTAITDSDGVARIEGIDHSDLRGKGQRLDAQVEYGGVTYRSSAQALPANGIVLDVDVFERGDNLDSLVVSQLQTMVYVWEEYLGFQQAWILTLKGDRALDTSLLDPVAFEHGIPLELPFKAEAINASAGGLESKVVNSTIFVHGVIKPGQRIPLRAEFSIPVDVDSYTYSQPLAYPTQQIDVGVMLDTGYQNYPRLRDLKLIAPGSDTVEARKGMGQMFQALGNRDFLVATGASLEAGETLRFRVEGLPFHPPRGPWIALGLGALGMLMIFGFGRLEARRMADDATTTRIAEMLDEERQFLLNELVALEDERDEGLVTPAEYEKESMMLRERLALIMKKLRDLDDAPQAAA